MKIRFLFLLCLSVCSASVALANHTISRDFSVFNATSAILWGFPSGDSFSSLTQNQMDDIQDQFVVHGMLRDTDRMMEIFTIAGSMGRNFGTHRDDACFTVLGQLNTYVDNLVGEIDSLSESFRMANSDLLLQAEKARSIADKFLAYCIPTAIYQKEFSVKKVILAKDVIKAVGELKPVIEQVRADLNQYVY